MMHKALILTWVLLIPATLAADPLGSEFTYQGELKQAGTSASGSFDFEFGLFDSPDGGVSLVAPIQYEDVTVADGIFTLELDFGSEVFDGTQLWIGVGVREGQLGGAFTALAPRQKLTATPYALHALETLVAGPADHAFLGLSTESTNGDNAYVNMALLCEADFPGSKVCSTTDLVNWSPPPDIAGMGLNNYGWMHVENQTILGPASVMDEATGFVFTDTSPPAQQVSLTCNGWLTLSNDYVGVALRVVSASDIIEYGLRACGNLQPVACCASGPL